jgi:hypothetical protein
MEKVAYPTYLGGVLYPLTINRLLYLWIFQNWSNYFLADGRFTTVPGYRIVTVVLLHNGFGCYSTRYCYNAVSCCSNGCFVFFLFYLFLLNLWKIIVNHRKNHKNGNSILLDSTWVDLHSEHIIWYALVQSFCCNFRVNKSIFFTYYINPTYTSIGLFNYVWTVHLTCLSFLNNKNDRR